MVEKNAQEQYEALRAQLKDIGQHGVLWALDKTVQALRAEHRAETQVALDARKPALNHGEAIEALQNEPVTPAPGEPGEGGGASSAAGSDDKAPLPDGAIA